MTAPTGGEGRFLHELECDVRYELVVEETGPPLQDGDGVPTMQWQMDPYEPRYEVGLRSLLGAIEAAEDDPGRGCPPG